MDPSDASSDWSSSDDEEATRRGRTSHRGDGRQTNNRWTKEEHAILEQLVAQYGEEKNWALISQQLAKRMPGRRRTGKQCRQRWVNFTRPGTKRAEWTGQEENTIALMHATHGPAWSIICKSLDNRTENSVKNHWHATLRSKNLETRRGSLLAIYIRLIKEGSMPCLSTYEVAKAELATHGGPAPETLPAATAAAAVAEAQPHAAASPDACKPVATAAPGTSMEIGEAQPAPADGSPVVCPKPTPHHTPAPSPKKPMVMKRESSRSLTTKSHKSNGSSPRKEGRTSSMKRTKPGKQHSMSALVSAAGQGLKMMPATMMDTTHGAECSADSSNGTMMMGMQAAVVDAAVAMQQLVDCSGEYVPQGGMRARQQLTALPFGGLPVGGSMMMAGSAPGMAPPFSAPCLSPMPAGLMDTTARQFSAFVSRPAQQQQQTPQQQQGMVGRQLPSMNMSSMGEVGMHSEETATQVLPHRNSSQMMMDLIDSLHLGAGDLANTVLAAGQQQGGMDAEMLARRMAGLAASSAANQADRVSNGMLRSIQQASSGGMGSDLQQEVAKARARAAAMQQQNLSPDGPNMSLQAQLAGGGSLQQSGLCGSTSEAEQLAVGWAARSQLVGHLMQGGQQQAGQPGSLHSQVKQEPMPEPMQWVGLSQQQQQQQQAMHMDTSGGPAASSVPGAARLVAVTAGRQPTPVDMNMLQQLQQQAGGAMLLVQQRGNGMAGAPASAGQLGLQLINGGAAFQMPGSMPTLQMGPQSVQSVGNGHKRGFNTMDEDPAIPLSSNTSWATKSQRLHQLDPADCVPEGQLHTFQQCGSTPSSTLMATSQDGMMQHNGMMFQGARMGSLPNVTMNGQLAYATSGSPVSTMANLQLVQLQQSPGSSLSTPHSTMTDFGMPGRVMAPPPGMPGSGSNLSVQSPMCGMPGPGQQLPPNLLSMSVMLQHQQQNAAIMQQLQEQQGANNNWMTRTGSNQSGMTAPFPNGRMPSPAGMLAPQQQQQATPLAGSMAAAADNSFLTCRSVLVKVPANNTNGGQAAGGQLQSGGWGNAAAMQDDQECSTPDLGALLNSSCF